MPHFNSKLFKRVIYFGWDDTFQEKHSFCCEKMDLAINFHCDQCRDDWECPDKIIYYNPVFDEYGLIIHDGSYSYILIEHCPWCGTRLPESKRDAWFDELEQKGYDDPLFQEIPGKYRSSAWFKNNDPVK